jgi:DNA-binding response OmpR family regulator
MPRSVLIVDEDHDLALGLSAVFDGEGYLVRYEFDGLGALRQIREDPPDLLVSDAILPGMSGVALARRMRRNGHAATVILTSDFYADVDLPGVRFLRKPIDLDELLRLVRRAFGEVERPSSSVGITRSRAIGRAGAGNGLSRSRGRPNQTVYK